LSFVIGPLSLVLCHWSFVIGLGAAKTSDQ
jgi:hypothetical protein